MAKKRVADHYDQVEVRSREELRAWLAANHERDQGVWLIHYKKHSEHHVPYMDFVEELLCFGWIDSLVRRVDEDRSMRLMTPRKVGSIWSQINKKAVKRLERDGRMTDAGRAVIERAKTDGSWTLYDEIEAVVVPDDLAKALKAKAREAWDGFSDSSKKPILWWIKSAKTEATRAKRIARTAERAAVGLRANFPDDEKKWKERAAKKPARKK